MKQKVKGVKFITPEEWRKKYPKYSPSRKMNEEGVKRWRMLKAFKKKLVKSDYE